MNMSRVFASVTSLLPTAAIASSRAAIVTVIVLSATTALAEETSEPPAPKAVDDATWSLDSPIGPFEYRVGRGLKVGDTGLHIGGFTEFEVAKPKDESGSMALDGINFLVLYEPIEFLRGFMELEVGDLGEVDFGDGKIESSPNAIFERLYVDAIFNDALNLRFGKFRTPISRRNLVPAEPFVWTTTQPEILQSTDAQQTGALLFGSFFPRSNTLKYWLYSQFIDPFDPESDEDPADRSIGGRLEYASSLETWSIATSFLASRLDGDWSYLTGLDLQLRLGPVELNSEFIYADRVGRNQYGFYLEGAYEIIPTFYLVSRYEYSDPVGSDEPTHLGDFGVAWWPRPYLYLKATYRIANEEPLDDERGLKASIAVLF